MVLEDVLKGQDLLLDFKQLDTVEELTNLAKLQSCTLIIEFLEGKGDQASSILNLYEKFTVSNHSEYNISKPFQAHIIGSRVLTGPDALKKVIELEIDIQGLGWGYEPGDAFAIICPNPHDIVIGLIQRLEFNPRQLFTMEPRKLYSLISKMNLSRVLYQSRYIMHSSFFLKFIL